MMRETAPILASFFRDGNERFTSANCVENKGKATFSHAQMIWRVEKSSSLAPVLYRRDLTRPNGDEIAGGEEAKRAEAARVPC